MIDIDVMEEETCLDRVVEFFENPIYYVADAYAEFVTDLRNKNRYIDYVVGAYVDFFKDIKDGKGIC